MQRRRWHPEDIKGEVRKKGTTLTQLALDNGLSDSACRAALIRPQPRAEKVIAEYLGVSLHQLWPDRYDKHGRRATRHERDENKRVRDRAHRQIVEAR